MATTWINQNNKPVRFGTSQLHVYGATVSKHCPTPSTKNATAVTPTLSLAVAPIVTTLFRNTREKYAGFVILTTGARVSTAGGGSPGSPFTAASASTRP